ncbi:alanine racemase, partial [Candidatus Curtissbacteria bacterium]|nr:alanine racemase [Candidatus Curtissbacteria bacterium]
ETVGYGREFKARQPTLVATLAVGYGDGFRRAPKNWGEVLIAGQRVSLIGRVSMDQAAVDITRLKGDIRRGEEVVLIGKSGSEELTTEEVAEKLGTISYEVVTAISARVPRIYR